MTRAERAAYKLTYDLNKKLADELLDDARIAAGPRYIRIAKHLMVVKPTRRADTASSVG